MKIVMAFIVASLISGFAVFWAALIGVEDVSSSASNYMLTLLLAERIYAFLLKP